MPKPKPAIQVAIYREATQAESAHRFQADSVLASGAGYDVLSQAWEGPVLTVTYQLRPEPVKPRPPDPVPAPVPSPPAAAAAPAQQSGATANVYGVMAVVGGIIVAGAAFLPWVTFSTSLIRASLSGMDFGGQGITVLVIGVGIILAGIGRTLIREPWLRLAYGSLGAVALLAALVLYIDMSKRVDQVTSSDAGTGFGLLVIAVGGAVAGLAGLLDVDAQVETYRSWYSSDPQ